MAYRGRITQSIDRGPCGHRGTRLCKENVAEIFRLLRQYKTHHSSVNRIFEQQAAPGSMGRAVADFGGKIWDAKGYPLVKFNIAIENCHL